MEMLTLLDNYINKLDQAPSMEESKLENLIEEITRVVFSIEELSTLVLNYYSFWSDESELISDTRKIKAKLEYKKASLIDADERERRQAQVVAEREQRELEKLRLQTELAKVNISIQNTNSNTNENHNNVSVSFESAREAVDNMTSLPEEQIHEVQKIIDELETIVKSADGKSKKWSKAKEIIKWVADKGVDVGLTLLPLILQIK